MARTPKPCNGLLTAALIPVLNAPQWTCVITVPAAVDRMVDAWGGIDVCIPMLDWDFLPLTSGLRIGKPWSM